MKRTLALLLLLTGCGAEPVTAEPPPDHTYACGGEVVPMAGLTGPPATQLGPHGQAALKGGEVRAPEDLESWHIVEETADRVALIGDLVPPVRHFGELRTHRYLLVERYGRDNAWNLRMSAQCALRRVVPGHGDAQVAVASASGDKLNLWVTEVECASGRPATGRITLVDLEETDEEVRIVVAVRMLQEDAVTCQGNPRTPFTVDLSRPLGDRAVLDAGVHPWQRL
ncbi:hypothetical protein [Herbidospora sp. RD11066]